MICPKCGRLFKFSPSERRIAERNGSVVHECSGCGLTCNASAADTIPIKQRAAYYRKHNLCVYCGKQRDPGYKSCSACRERLEKYKRKEYVKSIANEVKEQRERMKVQPKCTMTLDEICIAARKAGMSYGDYVAKYGL